MDKGKDFSRKPVIILGTYHSGTRALVEILSAFGSDSGKSDNHWKEERLFLGIHKEIIGKISNRGWTQTIYDIRLAKNFTDNKEHVSFIKKKIGDKIDDHFTRRSTQPWHWKVPSSSLFLPSWLEIYPDAYYIHLERAPLKVAESLLRRRQFYNPIKAMRFSRYMNERIHKHAPRMRHYILVSYDDLENEIRALVDFLPFTTLDATIEKAKDVIKKRKKSWWRREYSFRRNIWEYVIKALLFFAQFSREAQNTSKHH